MENSFEKESKADKAYRLDWNLDHVLPGSELDAWLRSFPNAPDGSAFCLIKEDLNLPERVEFFTFEDILETIDYPYNDVSWPIMSKRMLDTLLSVGDFRHRAYPLVMLNSDMAIHYDEDGNAQTPEAEYHNFFAVHVLEDLDVFDWENSIYERSERNHNVINGSTLEKLVLKEPPNGFPPIFRVDTPPIDIRLYVSAEACTALEAAGIRGVDFIQVENNYTLVSSLP
jgi:hypothetical protein